MQPSLEKFVDRLEWARQRKGCKWTEIASNTGITKYNISRYKTGYCLPSAPSLIKMALYLEIDAEWLAGDDVSIPDFAFEYLTVIYDDLNESGRGELLSQAERISGIKDYRKTNS